VSRRHLLPAIIGLVLLGVVVALVFQLSWQSQVLDLGFQGEAARNPLYLAERLLVALARQADGLRVVPERERLAPGDTLVMNTPSYTLTRQQMNALLDWVAGGGHLISRVHDEYDPYEDWGTDLLLDTLEIGVDGDGADDRDAAGQHSRSATGLEVRFAGRLRLQPAADEALFRIGDESGAYLLQYGWGEGWLTVLTDLSVFDNERLMEADHAEFFWQLMGAGADSGSIWLQYTRQVPSLLELLLRHAWMPLLGGTLALAAWLWQRAWRFGPLLVSTEAGRRSLLDHVQASGRFLWRRQLAAVLLAAVRRRSQRRLARRVPGWRKLGDDERAVHAARLARLPLSEVRAALTADRTDDFLSTVQILSKLANL